MLKRYQKVLLLYVFSTLVPQLFSRNSYKTWGASTAVGYGIFATGLKLMTRAKNRK
ncbi:hypothetical protein [Macrococcus brunensis]|uniref:hypothetical protein n=1 Tax=Macrococcus brunensis TaxID=198483 RepID=UPI001EF13457|nr:hypothetical protein [Macrococcus brunensis]ULG72056.1 hypothetical protein MGG12_00595 [Macrococcus brunensis]ULG74309.1 hypothetical protein MGG13_00620 [Macrococcus brunensis]